MDQKSGSRNHDYPSPKEEKRRIWKIYILSSLIILPIIIIWALTIPFQVQKVQKSAKPSVWNSVRADASSAFGSIRSLIQEITEKANDLSAGQNNSALINTNKENINVEIDKLEKEIFPQFEDTN